MSDLNPTKVKYTLPEMAMISFPLTDPKMQSWEKKSGEYSLFLASKTGVPYGKYARLALIVLCTEALKSKTGIFEIPSISSVMRSVELVNAPGKTITAFHSQLERLCSTAITFTHEYEQEGTKRIVRNYENMVISDKAEIKYLKTTKNGQRLLETAYIKFSKQFGQYVSDHPFPVDIDAFVKLSPLQGDIMLWASKKAPSLKKPVSIPLDKLVTQFYGPMQYPSDNYLRMWEAIDAVKIAYPKLKLDCEDGGKTIVMRHSDPQIDPEKAKAWYRMGRDWLTDECE